jgi:hypothetical protein
VYPAAAARAWRLLNIAAVPTAIRPISRRVMCTMIRQPVAGRAG